MKLVIKNARLAFPHVHNPSAFAAGDKPTFSATFIIPPDHPSVKEIEDASIAVAKEKWPTKWQEMLKKFKAKDTMPLHDGDTKSDLEGYAGNMFVNSRNPTRPTLRDTDGKTPLVEADGKPYGGCYVNGHIELWAQDNEYGQRINATLRGIQFYRDGDAFSGSAPASDDEFEALEPEEGDDML